MTLQELFARDGSWTQGALARDAAGEKCYPADPEAVCWCLVGGVLKVDYANQQHIFDLLSQATGGSLVLLSRWNDAPGRTIEDVRALAAKANV